MVVTFSLLWTETLEEGKVQFSSWLGKSMLLHSYVPRQTIVLWERAIKRKFPSWPSGEGGGRREGEGKRGKKRGTEAETADTTLKDITLETYFFQPNPTS